MSSAERRENATSEQYEMARTSVPFIINALATTLIVATLVLSDQRFTYFVLLLEALILVNVLAALANQWNLHGTKLLTYSLNMLLVIMLPLYILPLLTQCIEQSPAPLWFESVTYVVVVLLLIITLVSMFYSDFVHSFS
jgi:hypothetical protein